MIPVSYNQQIILEQLKEWNSWWYSMEEFANDAGFSTQSARYMLDTLCCKKLVVKLVDSLGEGYFLVEEIK